MIRIEISTNTQHFLLILSILCSMFQQGIIQIINILVYVVFPTIERIFRTMHRVQQPYHTPILSGGGWVQELLCGHPEHIRTELGVHEFVFRALISTLQKMGHSNSKFMTLEEQLAIFLYMAVTGLTIRHVGERFQQSNETISK
jgi:hypothetical protein